MKNRNTIIYVVMLVLVVLIIMTVSLQSIEADDSREVKDKNEESTTIKVIEDEPVPVGDATVNNGINEEEVSSSLFFEKRNNYRQNDFRGLIVDGLVSIGTYEEAEFKQKIDVLYNGRENAIIDFSNEIVTYKMNGYDFTVVVINKMFVIDSITIYDKNIDTNFKNFIGLSLEEAGEAVLNQVYISKFSNNHNNEINLGWYKDDIGGTLLILDNNAGNYSYCNTLEDGNIIQSITIAELVFFD